MTGAGRACSRLETNFTVNDFQLTSDGETVMLVDASLEQRGEGAGAPLSGRGRYDAR